MFIIYLTKTATVESISMYGKLKNESRINDGEAMLLEWLLIRFYYLESILSVYVSIQ